MHVTSIKHFCKVTTALISVNGHKVITDIYGNFIYHPHISLNLSQNLSCSGFFT